MDVLLVIGINMRAVCTQDRQLASDIPGAREGEDHAWASGA
jgi:hypothetical protein